MVEKDYYGFLDEVEEKLQAAEETLEAELEKLPVAEHAHAAFETLQQLQAGDRVDLTGFLRFYNGALPRITAITQSEGMLTEAS